MFKLKQAEGGTSASWGGQQFLADIEGFIEVPATAVADLAAHGWQQIGAAIAHVVPVHPALSDDDATRVEYVFANLAKVTDANFVDLAKIVIARAGELPAETADALKAAFGAVAPAPVEPVTAFLSHLGELSVTDIEQVIGAVIPKVQELMTAKAPPAPAPAEQVSAPAAAPDGEAAPSAAQ